MNKKINNSNHNVRNKILLIIGIVVTLLIVTAILQIEINLYSRKNYTNLLPSAVFKLIINLLYFIAPLIITIIIPKKNIFNKIKKVLLYIGYYIISFFIYHFLVAIVIFTVDLMLPNNDWHIYYKPILYLYPEKERDINIKIEHPEYLLTTYPKYNNGWNIHVLPDGSIYDKDNKYYYALYWDELQKNKVDFKEGFYVDKENAIDFLEEKLSIIGLNDKERNEFIMYWLPKLENNKKSLVYFELTNEINSHNKLIITPKPDSLLRVRIHIKKVDKIINIKEQSLPKFNRTGFSAIEWGGVVYD